ncbi:MAG TPA: Grx4 family monothiol glutaredoxin [Myxococcota bacterium]|jgi:monothiol glutaredoxin
MSFDPALRSRIESLVASDRVVLFMKGVRGAPQCGFSATVCRILDGLIPSYATVNVLADPELRDGVKQFSQWPTIPQLYVGGEFVGGCDIVQEMLGDGSLYETLGVPKPNVAIPALAITDAAARALRQLASRSAGPLHLSIDAQFQHGLFFGPSEPGTLALSVNGIDLELDPFSASRANGLTLDAETRAEGPAFRIDNPNAPKGAEVRQMSVRELSHKLAAGERFGLFDVRTPEERATAHIEGARLLDGDVVAQLEQLDKSTLLVFHCHHGGRSQRAAEHFASLGFTNVWNVAGGIDAWSQEVDPSVPRY